MKLLKLKNVELNHIKLDQNVITETKLEDFISQD